MGLDLLSFDRLIFKAREARNKKLIEEARINRIAIGSAFSGDNKAFDQLVKVYESEEVSKEQEAKELESNVKKLQRLFGG